MTNYTYRLVTEADTAEILGIYGPYVSCTAITFETEIPSLDEFRKRIQDISQEYPFIVCLYGNKIIGYAYSHRHMERAAYQWDAGLSVYIDKNHHGGGIGKKLYAALLEILKLQNIKNVYAGISSPNIKSEKLHEALGFKKLGTYHKTGYKCGAWHDVSWYEKTIGEYNLEPAAFLPVHKVDLKAIKHILDSYNTF